MQASHKCFITGEEIVMHFSLAATMFAIGVVTADRCCA